MEGGDETCKKTPRRLRAWETESHFTVAVGISATLTTPPPLCEFQFTALNIMDFQFTPKFSPLRGENTSDLEFLEFFLFSKCCFTIFFLYYNIIFPVPKNIRLLFKFKSFSYFLAKKSPSSTKILLPL